MNQLRVSHLEVRYGDLIGVADVSLQVEQGSVVAEAPQREAVHEEVYQNID